jgi:hypothetical protein
MRIAKSAAHHRFPAINDLRLSQVQRYILSLASAVLGFVQFFSA